MMWLCWMEDILKYVEVKGNVLRDVPVYILAFPLLIDQLLGDRSIKAEIVHWLYTAESNSQVSMFYHYCGVTSQCHPNAHVVLVCNGLNCYCVVCKKITAW